jgi:hypothetical protein
MSDALGTPDEAYAPELPPEVLRCVLAPLAGDVETLCAACCISKAFRAAAEEHPLC